MKMIHYLTHPLVIAPGILLMQTVGFWIASTFKKDQKWHDRFYLCAEVSEESEVAPAALWSLLTDPDKIMQLNYKNKIKWVRFGQPIGLGSGVRVKVRYGVGPKGIISHFEPESKIVFEYHSWPNATRYICELSMEKKEEKTRFILRMKVKKLFMPLLRKLSPNISSILEKNLSEMLHNCLAVCKPI